MDPIIKKRLLINTAIVLLLTFNGVQLYGIFSHQSAMQMSLEDSIADSSVAPVKINVLNGCGINGIGGEMTAFCRSKGYDVVEMGNYKSFDVDQSMIIDRSGKMVDAVKIASLLGISRENVVQQFNNDQLVSASIVIGKDYKSIKPWK